MRYDLLPGDFAGAFNSILLDAPFTAGMAGFWSGWAGVAGDLSSGAGVVVSGLAGVLLPLDREKVLGALASVLILSPALVMRTCRSLRESWV